jgi:hypothetical protein
LGLVRTQVWKTPLQYPFSNRIVEWAIVLPNTGLDDD